VSSVHALRRAPTPRPPPLRVSRRITTAIGAALAFASVFLAAGLFSSTPRANSCVWNSPYVNFTYSYGGINLANPSNNPILANPNVALEFWGQYWTNIFGPGGRQPQQSTAGQCEITPWGFPERHSFIAVGPKSVC
jgi:hypothetical protein